MCCCGVHLVFEPAVLSRLEQIHKLSHASIIKDPTLIQESLDVLLGELLTAWSSHAMRQATQRSQSGSNVVPRVLNYIERNQREAIRMADLCSHAGTSERTLQYAFKRHFQSTPKAYLNARRLHGVRKELITTPLRNVRDVAGEWGFWHMGQFAADYKNLFHELPSETLKRHKRG